ncbi:ABC transporter permease [Candidatus Kuenenbacteria bacterium]|nr:ABC transporter permease [Candidatus Kuenenbacteria bacterium]
MTHSSFRILKYAFQDFGRNIWLSLVTITVLVLALLSVNILVSLNAISDSVVTSVKDKVDVSVFFKTDVPQAQVDNFQEKIRKMPQVKETVFISKEQALDSFKEKHKDDASILEALREVEKNPLLDALIVKAQNIEDYNQILNVLNLQENQEIIKYQNYTDHKKIISRVNLLSEKVENVSLGLTIIFALIAVLIVFNAIRVTIYTHREEISVMRLVGASNSFIRAPFLVESILFSIFSCLIAFALLYLIFGAIGPYLTSFLETYNFNLIEYYNSNFFAIFFAELGAVVLLNVVSSGIAIGRYLKV